MSISAAEAYRRDREAHDGPFSSDDDVWILVATLVTQAARSSRERPLLRRAADLAAECFGQDELNDLARREWNHRPTRTDALLLLVGALQDAGALQLARAIVDGLLAMRGSIDGLRRGRLQARRAHLSRLLGDPELSAAQYAELRRMARGMARTDRAGSIELQTRAALGMSAHAQLRGNYPEVLRSGRAAVRLAQRSGLARLRSRAQYARMVAAAQLGHHDEALIAAWEMYQIARGDPAEETMNLAALGQLLLRLGRPAAAYSALSIVVGRRASTRILLGSLANIAVAAASPEVGGIAQVAWACDEVELLDRGSSSQYDLANALLMCASALERIGNVDRAAALRANGTRIAEANRYHELVFDAERMAGRGAQRLTPRAAAVVRHFANTAAQRLPAHVRPARAPVAVP